MTTAVSTPELSATDRCDRCGAQAYVRVTLLNGGDLTFCAHHWVEHEDALKSKALNVIDQTDKLHETS